LLKAVVPTAAHVAVLFNPDAVSQALDWTQTQVMARTLGVRLQPQAVRDPHAFEPAFAAMRQAQADALSTFGDVLTMQHRRGIVPLATQSRLPAIYELKAFVEAGGLMAYGPRLEAMYRRVAGYVEKILQGAKPAELPVEQPTQFELVINLRTAQALGLTIPPTLLFQADEVLRQARSDGGSVWGTDGVVSQRPSPSLSPSLMKTPPPRCQYGMPPVHRQGHDPACAPLILKAYFPA
jgi:putative ABC transport system substrate-binding protein